MRTTIRLDDDLFREAKVHAAQRGITLTRLIEEALKERLARQEGTNQQRRPRIKLPTFGGGGVRPGVNLDSWAELLDLMEEDDTPGR